VVRVIDVIDTPDGGAAMVMELLEGESLAERLERGELGLESTIDVVLPVMDAVASAHDIGIVHRDLKPSNIFLARGAEVVIKVLDFGIAKFRGGAGGEPRLETLTAPGTVVGTPCYMSPEQVFGERDIDPRADVWALGLIVYECLTGILPTRARTLGEVARLLVRGGVWPLRAAAPDLPADVIAVVDRMLVMDREQRAGDLRQIAALLGARRQAVRSG
jgi:serine/threonine-protein kinase